jgi:hypothetical protein
MIMNNSMQYMVDYVCYAGIWITDSNWEQDQNMAAINGNEWYEGGGGGDNSLAF